MLVTIACFGIVVHNETVGIELADTIACFAAWQSRHAGVEKMASMAAMDGQPMRRYLCPPTVTVP